MIEQNTNLLGKLESIEVNDQEQIYINKAIQQLKNEKQSEKIVIKCLIRNLRSIILNNHKLSEPALQLLKEFNKPNLEIFPQFGY